MEKRYAPPTFRCDFCLELITHERVPKELAPHMTVLDEGLLWFSKGEGRANWHTICLRCYDSDAPTPPEYKHMYEYAGSMMPTSSLTSVSAILRLFDRFSFTHEKVFQSVTASRTALEVHIGLKVYDEVKV